ncbi:hypothetical protein DXG01_011178 [Tephrocybe rancida]|nr:hypothetical protein DXG01_011178 [Tephrocybe rancida]
MDSLKWLVNQSTNQSVTETVAEAASGLLDAMKTTFELLPDATLCPDWISKAPSRSFYCFHYSELLFTCISTLEQRLWATNSGHDPNNVHIATWESLIQNMYEAASDGYQIGIDTWPHFSLADHLDDTALCERILDWSRICSETDGEFKKYSSRIVFNGGAAGARAFLHKFPKLLYESGLHRRTLFHDAAGYGNMNVVAAILEDHPSIISARAHADDKTALEHAAMSNAFDIVDFLLERGAERPAHLLHELIQKREFIQALSLMERGWNPFLEDESGETALEIANRMYHVHQGTLYRPDDPADVRERRICALGDILDKMKLMEGELPFFHQAAGCGNMRVVAAILEGHSSIISVRDIDDKTALEHAATRDKLDIVDFLLERGAERPPHFLHELMRRGKFIQTLSLMERGWSPLLKDDSGETALEIANRMYQVDLAPLFEPYIPVEERERQIRALGDLLDKIKLMEGELSKSESIDNTTATLTTS